ncbi:MAG: polyprenyl synthetase family protein [Candidatus Kaelpia aquatica]|nr:polyprenyl synthetase family protein [Candidatus Kaelpia aquatica]
MNIKVYLKQRKELVDEYIKYVFPIHDQPEKIHEALWFSMFEGGKRIRPIIMLAIADLAGVGLERVLNAAAGIEMIHSSTLILDDLPSMDDALIRRGKPALHKVYGESTAILTANILMLDGLKLITEDLIKSLEDRERLLEINQDVFEEIGKEGVMLGQFLDLSFSGKSVNKREIEEIHRRKTSSLFILSSKVAALLCGFKQDQVTALVNYAESFGMVFQISDDLLALEGATSKTGKFSLRNDVSPNYISAIGEKESRKKMNDCTKKAISNIKVFKKEGEALIELVKLLKGRSA